MQTCSDCGALLPDKAAFCPACGKDLGGGEGSGDGLGVFSFLRPEDKVYRNKFRAYGNTGLWISWNWAAYFFGWLWFGFRKMYLHAAMALIAYFFAGPLPVYMIILTTSRYPRINFCAAALLLSLFAGPAPLLFGILANGLYLRDLRERLSAARSFPDGDHKKQEYICRLAGVDRRYVLIGLALCIAGFLALMYYLATTCDPVGVFRLRLHRYLPDIFSRPQNVYHS
ncbi:MAG: zinc ribbon domain-containing protein [Abditibacteriota bacterium]|nr:zinc ribbon domain-containing protein [Abditibacteriota bacterium]